MFALYSGYLGKTQVAEGIFSCAPITKAVAHASVWVVEQFGYASEAIQNSGELSLTMYINETAVSRVIEGCNAVSIIVLFTAFIIAFSNRFVPTLFYVLFGSLLIYAINILRIAVIGIGLYEFPEYKEFLHEILFPALIYGLVLVLWVIWVQNYSKVKHA